ncbi:MAG TPA: nucleotide exchange factor GrpE [Anaerolineales bacterium]
MTDKKKLSHEKHSAETEPTHAKPAQEEADDTAQAQDSAQAELEKARAQVEEYLDGWKRTQADFSNYRKRIERDEAEARIQAVGRAASRWFPILDDFERALKEKSASENLEQWAAGVELIYRKGVAALEAEGVTSFEAETGSEFDPGLHEAVTMEPCPDKKDGEILGTIRCGYRLGDRVLRPAQVRVACRAETDPHQENG